MSKMEISEKDSKEVQELKQMINDRHLERLEEFNALMIKRLKSTAEILEMTLEEFREHEHMPWFSEEDMKVYKATYAVHAIKSMLKEAEKEK